MAMPITQERAERRALILGYLANHGPCPTRPIYEAIKELSDSSEAARLIYDMKAAGEIVSDAVELSEVQRLHWRIPPSAGRLVQVHRLASIGEPAPLPTPALAASEPPATPAPAAEPEPESAEETLMFEDALMREPDYDDDAPWAAEVSYWLSADGELRIVDGCLEMILSPAQFRDLRDFLRRIEPLLGDRSD